MMIRPAGDSCCDFEKVNGRLGTGLEFRLQPVCILQLSTGPRERGTPNGVGPRERASG